MPAHPNVERRTTCASTVRPKTDAVGRLKFPLISAAFRRRLAGRIHTVDYAGC
jgi:hypothetical protein